MNNTIEIKGARENNLKNISVCIPKNKLVVLTGLSGSGKSTFAMETLQKECQRQYMESMGMITELLSKPKVDSITGLSPSISIDQRNSNRNPRSTVGTVTEVLTYLRILYAKLGVRNCPFCGKPIPQTFEQEVMDEYAGDEEASLPDDNSTNGFEEMMPCPHCGKQVPVLTMSHFSFNKPQGACPQCKGLGTVSKPDLTQVLNMELSIRDGAVLEWDKFFAERYAEAIENAGKHYGFEVSANTPLKEYGPVQMDLVLYGVLSKEFTRHFPGVKPPKTVAQGRYEGIVTNLMRRFGELRQESGSSKLENIFVHHRCPLCGGKRLRKESLAVTVGGVNIVELSKKSLYELADWIKLIHDTAAEDSLTIAQPIIDDLSQRVQRLLDVGVGYLSMERAAPTLSAGEAQRLRLASLLGSGLTGVLYVLDEPTTGLHARDTKRLIDVLIRLRNLDNTVLVIEHDVEMMRAADYIIDFGPGAGCNGGEVVAFGTPSEVGGCKESITARYLSGECRAVPPKVRRAGNGKNLTIYGACENNLQNVDAFIPLGTLVSVTGVSGSGKSTLVFDIIDKTAKAHFNQSKEPAGNYHRIDGWEGIDGIITIDQTPIGRTPRSNAATYTDIFTYVRSLYASLPDAKKNGLLPNHFSFNVAGGRCEKCEGAGELTIPMHFLPDVQVPCPVCRGKRFKKEILAHRYKGRSIADVLDMTIVEATELFNTVEPIADRLSVLNEVGLGYLKLGQPATTLSGGEAQRIKLAKELGKRGKNHTLYLMDEPSTGLHPHDVQKLTALFMRLVEQGNTVVVVEHNTDIIMMSDWVIDFGPEGGEAGGRIIAQGSPEQVAQEQGSQTGQILKELLLRGTQAEVCSC